MAQALAGAFGPKVKIHTGTGNFLEYVPDMRLGIDAVITNPPYGAGGRLALRFIETALSLQRYHQGMVAMLLKFDYDNGVTRSHVFKDCPAWARKIVLGRRIMWFPSETGNGPSENHAWFVWDWRHSGPPISVYAF